MSILRITFVENPLFAIYVLLGIVASLLSSAKRVWINWVETREFIQQFFNYELSLN